MPATATGTDVTHTQRGIGSRSEPRASPAMMLGYLDDRLSREQVLSWRQDWGHRRSVHPQGARLLSVAEFRAWRADQRSA